MMGYQGKVGSNTICQTKAKILHCQRKSQIFIQLLETGIVIVESSFTY